MSVTNFQGIAEAKVTFTGGTCYISGDNGQGKSSFLNAVACLFFGPEHAGKVPLKSGAKRGEIVGMLSNGLTCRMTVSEKGIGSLTITDSEGLTKGTPRAILNKLMGSLAFDPLRFVTELNEKQQIAELKTICGLDFTELDRRRAELYARRTDVNREAKSVDAAFQTAPWHTDAPKEEIDVATLMALLKAAQDHNAAIDTEGKTIAGGEASLVKVQQRIAALQAELAAEIEKEKTWTLAISERKAAFEKMVKQDATTIEQQIADSGKQNAKRAANAARDALMERADHWQKESVKLTAEIDAIDAEKTEKLANAKMPIDGLSFSDDFVTWKGIPLSQVSTREQMEASFAICASLNPTLRCVIVPHGSLITPSNRPHFEAIAQKYGMQPLVELADESGEVPGIVISAGRVVRADNQTEMPADQKVKIALEPKLSAKDAAFWSDPTIKPVPTKPAASPVMQDGPFA